MANRVVSVILQAEIGQYVSKMTQAASVTDTVGKKAGIAGKDVGKGFDLAGKGAMLLGGAVVLGLGAAVSKSMEFEKSMSGVQAATQASAATLGDLRDAAMKAGADTQYSATEAADAVTEMAKAGVGAADIMGGGLTGALDLAASGQLEVADAAGIASTAMTQFSLSGEQLPHVADLLAAGAGKAMGSVGDLGMALNQAGLVASATGLSIEETTGTLAAFASAGLIGSDAGTSFKSMLQALQNPSKQSKELMDQYGLSLYDAQGQFVGMSAMAGQLQGAFGKLTPAVRDQALAQIFGSDAVRAANVLYKEGAGGIADWTSKVNDAGYAQRQAAQLTDNLAGDLERLGGSFDTLLITLGEGSQGPLRLLVQGLGGVLDVVTGAVEAFDALPGPVQAGVIALGALALLNGPLSGTLATLKGFGGNAITPLRDSMSAFSEALGYARANGDGLGTVMKSVGSTAAGGLKTGIGGLVGMLGGPFGLALAGATVGIGMVSQQMSEASDQTDEWAQAMLDGSKSQAQFNKEYLAQFGGKEPDWLGHAAIALGFASSLDEAAEKAKELYDAMSPLEQRNADVAKAQRELEEAVAAGGPTSADATVKAVALAQAQANLAAGQGDVKAATDNAAGAISAALDPAAQYALELQGAADAAGDAKKATDLFKLSLDILTGASVSIATVEAAYYDALTNARTATEGLSGAVVTAAGDFDRTTEAGRAAQAGLFSLRDTTSDYIATMIEHGESVDAVVAKDNELRQGFYDAALAATGSATAAQALTDKYYGIPEERRTKIEADMAQASGAIGGVQGQINTAGKGTTVPVNADTSPARTALAQFVADFQNKYIQTHVTATYSPLSGGRAAGGPVAGGNTYLVGERGPELVQFGASGYVTPANITAGILATGARFPGLADGGLVGAAQELLGAINSGKTVYEDYSWRGMSANMDRYNEALVKMAPVNSSDPRATAAWLSQMIQQRSSREVRATPAAAPTVKVPAPVVHIYLDGEEWRGIARVEASAVTAGAFDVFADRLVY